MKYWEQVMRMMWKRGKGIAIGFVLGLIATGVAWACGPHFPSQLLDNREASLKATPVRSFATEVVRMVQPSDTLKAREDGTWNDPDRSAMAESVTDDPGADLGGPAEDAGDAGSLDEWQLYALGAAVYHRAMKAGPSLPAPGARCDADCAALQQQYREDLMRAADHFERIIALPPGQATQRATYAAYSLGRIHSRLAALETDPRAEIGAAVKMYQTVRQRVLAGGADDDGLAVSSYGEEARLHLYRERTDDDGTLHFCLWQNPKCEAPFVADRFIQAIHLYAEQAARDSPGGVNSLRFMGEAALEQPDLLPALIADPLAQRLLVNYVLAYSGDSRSYDAGGDASSGDWMDHLGRLVDAIGQQNHLPVQGTGQLAALAYRTGRYDLAARLAGSSATPLATWIRAKLALQRGDMEAAAALYAEAAKAFSTSADSNGWSARITGEQGVLALAREEYVEAMHLLYAAQEQPQDVGEYATDYVGYADDASYVAERVLTLNELRAFVDSRVHAIPPPVAGTEGGGYRAMPYSERLRWLLARRLMRAGRFDEAIGYFPVKDDPRIADIGDVDLQALARQYGQAVRDGNGGWTRLGRAEAFYRAATIAKLHGMELLGYEQVPDAGGMSGGVDIANRLQQSPVRPPYVSKGEMARLEESRPQPDYRFHYRFTAVDLASKAADNLPPRSQAFAAVLCEATGWMMEGPPDYRWIDEERWPNEPLHRIRALYKRYVQQGPYVPWAADFGRHCEAPDFGRARELQRAQDIRAVKRFVRAYGLYIGTAAILLAGLSGWMLVRRRSRRKTAA